MRIKEAYQELFFGYSASLPEQIETVLTSLNDITPDTKHDITSLLEIAYNQGIIDGIIIAEQTSKKERTKIMKKAFNNKYEFKTFLFFP